MLLYGILNELGKTTSATSTSSSSLLSYFFYQATDLSLNNTTAILRGLIYLLTVQQPALLQHIRKRYNITREELFRGTNSWFTLCEIFNNILQDPSLGSTYVIINALNEYVTGHKQLLRLIKETSPAHSRIKWIVSSRN
jgi:hypothetical protein